MFAVLDELEALKPEFQSQVDELNKAYARIQHGKIDGPETISYVSEPSSSERPSVNKVSYSNANVKQVLTWKECPIDMSIASLR